MKQETRNKIAKAIEDAALYDWRMAQNGCMSDSQFDAILGEALEKIAASDGEYLKDLYDVAADMQDEIIKNVWK